MATPPFSVVCRFLENWKHASARLPPGMSELAASFGVFRLDGAVDYVHEEPKISSWWRHSSGDHQREQLEYTGQCLITGGQGPIARLHQPRIVGVNGLRPTGGVLVSFNHDAFASYGKQQGGNAPVCPDEAYQYCAALNHLLSSRRNRALAADATTVFWTEEPSSAVDVVRRIFDPRAGGEDETSQLESDSMLEALIAGGHPLHFGDPNSKLYIVGFSPNSGRISVRFWHVDSLSNLATSIRQHFNDLAIGHAGREAAFPSVRDLLRETAGRSTQIPANLSGPLIRSIFNGLPYPKALLDALLRRITCDRKVNYVRAAMIKAYLNRNARLGVSSLLTPIDTEVDARRPETAYQLGRYFAVMEKLHEDAFWDGLKE
ncbi:MAG: type I-C CRISPR-associated protein Cas8c/Csd1, partial [Pirellulales bacterium]|nr:type I-C CRISPR-associated protein Cas8c/Csd1 [Pirellulales bacterium]